MDETACQQVLFIRSKNVRKQWSYYNVYGRLEELRSAIHLRNIENVHGPQVTVVDLVKVNHRRA